MRKANFGNCVGRGVWVAPWMGPEGETVLVAVRRDGRLVGYRALTAGDDHIGASDQLWSLLDDADPERCFKVI